MTQKESVAPSEVSAVDTFARQSIELHEKECAVRYDGVHDAIQQVLERLKDFTTRNENDHIGMRKTQARLADKILFGMFATIGMLLSVIIGLVVYLWKSHGS